MSDQIVVEAANYLSEIRTRDSSKQGTADRFRPHSHRYWQSATQIIHFQKWRKSEKGLIQKHPTCVDNSEKLFLYQENQEQTAEIAVIQINDRQFKSNFVKISIVMAIGGGKTVVTFETTLEEQSSQPTELQWEAINTLIFICVSWILLHLCFSGEKRTEELNTHFLSDPILAPLL